MGNTDFAGRVAVVTGAWRGLGRAAAARLHERGAFVAVNVRNRKRAEALAEEIGERAFAVPGDVAAEGVPDEIGRASCRERVQSAGGAGWRAEKRPRPSVDRRARRWDDAQNPGPAAGWDAG